MTICIATDGYPPQVGGIATFNQHLVTLLTAAGHKAIVLYVDYDNEDDDLVTTDGNLTKVQLRKTFSKYYKQWQPYFRPGGFNAPNWIATGFAMQEWLLQNRTKYNIDIIEASDYGGCSIFLVRDDLPPVVITGHGSLLQYSRYNFTIKDDNYNVVRQLEEFSFLAADAIIAHSLLNKEDLTKLFKREILLAKIPWTDSGLINESAPSTENIIVVGGLQPIKGIYDTATAMEILQEQKSPLELHWIGGDTWLAPGQQKMSTYLESKYPTAWQKNLIWENERPLDYTQKAIAACSLVVVPAFFETFNYIALEAAAYGKAILITEKTGASFLFTHGVNAWKIEANQPAAIAGGMRELMADPALRESLGKMASTLLHEEFAPEKILNERLTIYKNTIEKRQKIKNDDNELAAFLNKYRTSFRKYYYFTRKVIKKIMRRS